MDLNAQTREALILQILNLSSLLSDSRSAWNLLPLIFYSSDHLLTLRFSVPPAADFVTGELDLAALTEMPSPKSHSSDTVTSTLSPRTPRSPVGSILLDGDNFELGKSDEGMAISKTLNQMSSTLPYPLQPLNYKSWGNDNSIKENNSFTDPIFSTMQDQVRAKTPEVIIDSRYGEKQTVTVNVKVLLDGE